MQNLSPHFSVREFVDKRTGELIGPSARLLQVLEYIRGNRGRPLTVISGYRSEATNRAVGGAPHSQHLLGAAADISPRYCTLALAVEAGATGIGVAGDWVTHVDVRLTPGRDYTDMVPVVWYYATGAASSC